MPALSQYSGGGILTDDLIPPLRAAWEDAWSEQLNELASLDAECAALSASTAALDAVEADADALDLVALWKESENATDLGLPERTARARHVTQVLMRFWRSATPRNDNLEPRMREEIVREPMSRAVALAERRRQLRRHAAAGVVEYRIFGEVLSRDAAALGALPHAGLVSLESAWRQLGALSNVTGLAAQAPRARSGSECLHASWRPAASRDCRHAQPILCYRQVAGDVLPIRQP